MTCNNYLELFTFTERGFDDLMLMTEHPRIDLQFCCKTDS